MRLLLLPALLSPALLLSLTGVPSAAPVSGSAPPVRQVARRADRTVWDSVFTAEQAARGEAGYEQNCARCHQSSLGGADEAPALAGATFLGKWNGLTLGDLHDRVRRTMPPREPGLYGRPLVTDVIAYLLSVNEFPSGKVELPVEPMTLQGIRIRVTRR